MKIFDLIDYIKAGVWCPHCHKPVSSDAGIITITTKVEGETEADAIANLKQMQDETFIPCTWLKEQPPEVLTNSPDWAFMEPVEESLEDFEG